MAPGERLRGAWSRVWRYLDALAGAADYDPLEEQRRWIAGLEARVARVEATLSTEHGNATTKTPET